MANLQDMSTAASGAKKLATIAKIVAGLKKVQAANTQGLNRPAAQNRSGGSGSSGAVGAPVSTLASLPQTPELQALIQQGIIREGMPPEQALAIMSISKLGGQVPIDIAALKASVEGNYEKYTGDITTAGADWMKQIMGQNMPEDPAMAALYAQDPLFTGYAGSLAQMDETADTNLATDLAWFDKQQSAYGDYYNSLLAGAQAGTLLPAATGGGGGGGGGGRRGGGYGGGGGGGSGEAGDLRTTITTDQGVTETANERVLNTLPGFRPDMLGFASQFGPEVTDQIEEILNLTPSGRGQDVLAALEETQLNMDAQNAAYEGVQENNKQWSLLQPAEFRRLLDQYEQTTGLSLGDDPNMPGEQAFHYAERTGDDPRTVDKVEGEDNVYSYGPADIALMQPEQRAEIEELRALVEPALLGATGNNVNDPANISKAANAVGYLQSLAKNRVVGNAAGGISALVGGGNNQTAADAVQAAAASVPTAAQPVTPDIMSKLQEVFGNISQQEAPQYNALDSANPGSLPVGGIPRSGGSFPVRPQRDPDAPIGPSGIPASDPAILNTSEWIQDPNAWNPLMPGPLAAVPGQDAIEEANAPQSEQAMQGIAALVKRAIESRPPSPTQLYNKAGTTAGQANNQFRANQGRASSDPLASVYPDYVPPGGYSTWGETDSPFTAFGSTTHQVGPNTTPGEFEEMTGMSWEDYQAQNGDGIPQSGSGGGSTLAELLGNAINTATGGNPAQTTSSGEGFVPQNQAILQGLARAGLINRPQQGTPGDPTSDIARAIAGAQRLAQASQPSTQIPGALPDVASALQDPEALRIARRDKMVEEFEGLGYSGEDAQNYRHNWRGMNVSPETMREQYLQDALINEPSWGNPEGSGRLKDVVERLMQSRSLAALQEATPNYTAEERRDWGEEGEFYKKDAGITDEQYRRNQNFVNLIPTFQDYINTGGNQPGGFSYNPNADDTIIYSNFNTAVRNAVKNATSQRAFTDSNPNDPSGFYPPTEEMPYGDFDLVPPETDIGYDSTFAAGSGKIPQIARPNGKDAADTARLLAQSALQMRQTTPATRTLPTSKVSTPNKRNVAPATKAAQGAKAVATLANVLKNFKKR